MIIRLQQAEIRHLREKIEVSSIGINRVPPESHNPEKGIADRSDSDSDMSQRLDHRRTGGFDSRRETCDGEVDGLDTGGGAELAIATDEVDNTRRDYLAAAKLNKKLNVRRQSRSVNRGVVNSVSLHRDESRMLKNRKMTITGVKESTKLTGVERNRWVFVSRMHPDTTIKDVTDYLTENEFVVKECHKLEIRASGHSAFKIAVPESSMDLILDGNKWPRNTIVREFYNRRQKAMSAGEESHKGGRETTTGCPTETTSGQQSKAAAE